MGGHALCSRNAVAVKRSQGLQVYKELAKERAKGGGPAALPTYMDGQVYRIGDEVLEGTVSYYRPARDDEDQAMDKWRLVVRNREDTKTLSIPPSQTRAINRKEPQ